MRKASNTKKIVMVGTFSAIAFLLQMLGSMMGLKVGGFLEIEISDLPALIISFAYGPLAGILVELLKNLLHCFFSSTGFVGELANFAIGCAFVIPASIIYKYKKTVHGAIVGLAVSILCMAIVGGLMNYFVMLPLYGVNDQACAGMGKALGNYIVDKKTMVLFAVVPFNAIKGFIDSFITLLIYKRLSEFIKKHI